MLQYAVHLQHMPSFLTFCASLFAIARCSKQIINASLKLDPHQPHYFCAFLLCCDLVVATAVGQGMTCVLGQGPNRDPTRCESMCCGQNAAIGLICGAFIFMQPVLQKSLCAVSSFSLPRSHFRGALLAQYPFFSSLGTFSSPALRWSSPNFFF